MEISVGENSLKANDKIVFDTRDLDDEFSHSDFQEELDYIFTAFVNKPGNMTFLLGKSLKQISITEMFSIINQFAREQTDL